MSTPIRTRRTPVDLGPPMLLRPEEAAKMLGLSRSKVFQMLAAGELPVVRIGRSVRLPSDELRVWIRRKAEHEAREFREHWRGIFEARKEEAHRRDRSGLRFEQYFPEGRQ